jgi:hypothetical protein
MDWYTSQIIVKQQIDERLTEADHHRLGRRAGVPRTAATAWWTRVTIALDRRHVPAPGAR